MNCKMFVRIKVLSYETVCYSIPFFLFNGIMLASFMTDFGFFFFFLFYVCCEHICLVKLQNKYLTGLGFPVVLPSALHFSENVPRWFPLCMWPNCSCSHHLALIPQWASQGSCAERGQMTTGQLLSSSLCMYAVNTRSNWKYGKLNQLPAGQNSCWAAVDRSWC